MATILQINSSLFGEEGQSSQLSHFFVEQYLASIRRPSSLSVTK